MSNTKETPVRGISAEALPQAKTHSADPKRILVVSHSHPEISKGGAEIAAYQLYRGFASRPNCVALLLGCDRRPTRSDTAITQPVGVGDYLYSVGAFDWFKFSNRDLPLPKALTELLLELRPDVVHFHDTSVLESRYSLWWPDRDQSEPEPLL